MRRSTTTRALILGGALAGALTLGATQLATGDDVRTTAAAAPAGVTAGATADPKPAATETERGIVLEGTGAWRGQDVRVFVYENQRHGNTLQIVVGDPDGQHAIGAGEGRDAYVTDGVLNVGLDVDGDLAVVKGTVTEAGAPLPVVEDQPDGELVSSSGTHTPLRVQATFTYRGESVALQFPQAFGFDLASVRATTD